MAMRERSKGSTLALVFVSQRARPSSCSPLLFLCISYKNQGPRLKTSWARERLRACYEYSQRWCCYSTWTTWARETWAETGVATALALESVRSGSGSSAARTSAVGRQTQSDGEPGRERKNIVEKYKDDGNASKNREWIAARMYHIFEEFQICLYIYVYIYIERERE